MTNKNRTGPKWVRTQDPEDEPQATKTPPSSTLSSPMKATKDALELAVASLPTSLQPFITHFSHKIITARCKRYAKDSIAQRMEQDKDYIPRSAKASDFKITLSPGTKEDEERVSFLELQIQQAKAKYESSLEKCNRRMYHPRDTSRKERSDLANHGSSPNNRDRHPKTTRN